MLSATGCAGAPTVAPLAPGAPTVAPLAPGAPTGVSSPGSSAGTGTTPQSIAATVADGRLPADLQPPLASAKDDVPLIYRNGCHLGFRQTQPGDCVFGDPSSSTVVVLFGDSLAGQWFPALDKLATDRHWRLVSLTKSACTAADVTVWNSALGGPYTECDEWRQNVFGRIGQEHPSLVVVSDDRFYELAIAGSPVPLAQRAADWDAGLERTLTRLRGLSGSVALIEATPRARVVPAVCLDAHPTDLLACATPLKDAIDPQRIAADQEIAAAAGARFIDPTAWVCPTSPCPPVIGQFLVYREQDHLTAAFAVDLADQLGATLALP